MERNKPLSQPTPMKQPTSPHHLDQQSKEQSQGNQKSYPFMEKPKRPTQNQKSPLYATSDINTELQSEEGAEENREDK